MSAHVRNYGMRKAVRQLVVAAVLCTVIALPPVMAAGQGNAAQAEGDGEWPAPGPAVVLADGEWPAPTPALSESGDGEWPAPEPELVQPADGEWPAPSQG